MTEHHALTDTYMTKLTEPDRHSMSFPVASGASSSRTSPIEIPPAEFRRLGHALVDAASELLASLPERPVSPGLTPSIVRAAMGDDAVPERGADPSDLLRRATELLARYSTFNGHPRFFGYITSSAAPLGILADLLAETVNANCGAWSLSPAATEIERRTVRWIAELLGLPSSSGGLFVSGGNMANIVAALSARAARAGWNVREHGVAPPGGQRQLAMYASTETHTWIQKAAELCGIGAQGLRWIPVDSELRMRLDALESRIEEDRQAGLTPFMVIGTAGTVSTGAVDPLRAIGALCRKHGIWFHVDGAYGAPAAMLPEANEDLKALRDADSVAMDPHKWLYAPLEAGCVLVRDAEALHDAFHFKPPYYHFPGDPEDMVVNFHEWGPQNSRGNRALKVWLTLQQVGREGYVRMIRDDIALARTIDARVREIPDLEPATCELSITTFRFVPSDLRSVKDGGPWRVPRPDDAKHAAGSVEARDAYLDRLNTRLLSAIQDEGLAYLSNAVLGGRFHLRSCIVNFRTSTEDARALPEIAARIGRLIDRHERRADSPYSAATDGELSLGSLETLADQWWRARVGRLLSAQRSFLEMGIAAAGSPVFASRMQSSGNVDITHAVKRLAAADRDAADRIRAWCGEEPSAAAEARAKGVDALRDAQGSLLEAIALVRAEHRLLERGIVHMVERRALDYEALLGQL
jgi:aromatic-L-amino-acid/L-tryptophan decarboxylase